MSCGTTLETATETSPPPSTETLQPVELGSVDPPSSETSEPVDLAPADLGSVDPVSGGVSPTDDESLVAPPPSVYEPPAAYDPPAAYEPPSAEPVSEPTGPSEPAPYEPPATPAQAPEPQPAPAWTPPVTSAPAAAPAPSWQQPAAAPAPAWTPPAAAPPPAAPAPQPMPPPPNPTPGDPFALGAAAQRLDPSAQAAARTALVASAALMVQGERVEAVTQGRIDGVAAVLTLTDRRLLAVNQRDWQPFVTWFNLDPQLDVQAWEDQSGATIVLSAAGRQVTTDGITDKQPAYELVARLRARLGR
jgi:hypothetical protein